MPRWLAIAGERSSDQMASAIMQHISQHADVSWVVLGGSHMAQHATTCLGVTVDVSSVGIIESLTGRRRLTQLCHQLDAYLSTHSLDRAIIFDFPHYHRLFAKVLQRHHVPIDTVITPHFWMWNDRKRGQELIQYSQRIITIFKREYEWYQSLGATPIFVGHPLLDRIEPAVPRRPTQWGDMAPHSIGIFPGSRPNEIKRLLPTCLRMLTRLSPHWHTHVMVPIEHHSWVQPMIDQAQIAGGASVSLHHASPSTSLDVAVVATGTMSLELILNRIPIVVIGALHPLSYWIATRILRLSLPFIGLPNLILGHRWVTELAQFDLTPSHLADALCHLLTPLEWDRIQAAYPSFISYLGQAPVVSQMSQVILEAFPVTGPSESDHDT